MLLTPLEAYDLSGLQKIQCEKAHFARVVALCSDKSSRAGFSPARVAFDMAVTQARQQRPYEPLSDAVRRAYRDVALTFGLRRIDPRTPEFEHDLDVFFSNYQSNFPLQSEQETKEGFRNLLRAAPSCTGYEERVYSIVCPLTGQYLMGLDFAIQPLSDSVHFVYGFAMPCVRGGWGFGRALIALIREIAGGVVAACFRGRPDDLPSWNNPDGPLILFAKNMIGEMTLSDILMDSAGIDVAAPPSADADLASSGIGQSLRDLVWDRLGAKVVRYNYFQSSLDGVVAIAREDRDRVICGLNKRPQTLVDRVVSERALTRSLDGREKGFVALDLCAFVDPGQTSLPAAQVKRANEIFQSVSVVKDAGIDAEIYFQAQMSSLMENSRDGRVAIDPIRPFGFGAGDSRAAEELTRRLLAVVTWAELRQAGERTYEQWLVEKADLLALPNPIMAYR
jgi:hypothetical protein